MHDCTCTCTRNLGAGGSHPRVVPCVCAMLSVVASPPPPHLQSVDEQSIGSSDTSSSVDSGTRVLTQQSAEPMSLGEKVPSVDEKGPSVDEDPGDTSRDSGINEPSSLTGDDPAPTTNQSNTHQKDITNNGTKVKIIRDLLLILC